MFAVTDEISRWAPSKILKEGKMPDPHVWFDVSLWAMTVKLIADRLSDFDPEHASEFIDNANALSAKLESLHAECQSAIAEIPKSQRVLITAHDAFRYFERAYGFQVKAIQGVSTVAAASTKHMEELTNFIVEHKIKAIFVETSVPDDNVKQLIESCEKQNHKLVIGGKLFSDAMGKPGTTDGTYIGMIRRNFKTIVKALK
ncbi:MAG: zinc ABC transporter substrate-binding protein [Planctomycetes bacterium]|nr:zinc ABC transporter substrate-binding protein [Planctomycetota bacterium]